MRIAILFSGHFRNFDKLVQNFSEKLLYLRENHKVDLFFSLWNTTDCLISWGKPETDIVPVLTDIWSLQILNPAAIEIENYRDVCENFWTRNFYDNFDENRYREIAEEKMGRHTLFAIPQLYKIWKCNELKNRFAKLNNISYDLVIRYRTNLLALDKFPDFKPESNTIYGINERCDLTISDMVLAGNEISMKYYADIYNNLRLILNNISLKNFLPGTERILYEWLICINNLDYKYIDFKIEIVR